MTRRSLSISRILYVLTLSLGLLCVPKAYLDAQKTVPKALNRDDAADLAFCPRYMTAVFTGPRTKSTYIGQLPRGADGIGKVFYQVNGITDTKALYAAWGNIWVQGWICRILGDMGIPFYLLGEDNVGVDEREISPIDYACGGTGGSGGGFGDHPPTGGDANRVVPVRFDCQGGGSGTTTGTIVTVTTCYGYVYYDAHGNFLFAEISYCTQFQYMM